MADGLEKQFAKSDQIEQVRGGGLRYGGDWSLGPVWGVALGLALVFLLGTLVGWSISEWAHSYTEKIEDLSRPQR